MEAEVVSGPGNAFQKAPPMPRGLPRPFQRADQTGLGCWGPLWRPINPFKHQAKIGGVHPRATSDTPSSPGPQRNTQPRLHPKGALRIGQDHLGAAEPGFLHGIGDPTPDAPGGTTVPVGVQWKGNYIGVTWLSSALASGTWNLGKSRQLPRSEERTVWPTARGASMAPSSRRPCCACRRDTVTPAKLSVGSHRHHGQTQPNGRQHRATGEPFPNAAAPRPSAAGPAPVAARTGQ